MVARDWMHDERGWFGVIPQPPRLYHYTDAVGLMGVVEGGAFWATDTRFLNDAVELRWAARRVLDDMSDRLAPDDWRRQVVSDCLDPDPTWRTCVACFCDHGDLLSQWRAYASDEGFALGFDFEFLPEEVYLRQIQYDGQGSDDDPIADLVGTLESLGVGDVDTFRALIQPALAKIKNGSFSEEREWRLMKTLGRDARGEVEFRRSPYGVVPYLQIPFDRSSLKEVVVGPGRHAEARSQGVREWLRSLDLAADVRRSLVPLR